MRSLPHVTLAVAVLAAGLVAGCPDTGTGGTPAEQQAQALMDFNSAAADFGQKHFNFVSLTQKWEGKEIKAGNLAEVISLWNEYYAATQAWAAAGNLLNTHAAAANSATQKRLDTANGTTVAGAPVGPPIGLIKGIGDDIGGANAAVQAAMAKYPDWEDDADQAQALQDELNQIRKDYSTSAFRRAISAITGTAGAAAAGGTAYVLIATGVITVSAPAALVIGGAAFVGGVVTGAVTWWWTGPSSCASGDQKGLNYQGSGVCTFASGQVNPGEPFPSVMPEPGGTLTISVPGYLPVTVTDFQPPGEGKQLTIDFPKIPITAENVGQTITVDFSEIVATGDSVEDIVSISATPNPLDPAPFQSVVVTVTVFPPIPNIPVEYALTGTDGYTKSGSPLTDANGQITFNVPGGAADVHDAIEIKVGNLTYAVTYTF